MKVIFSCLLATGLLFSLTGCGNGDKNEASIDSISAETTTKAKDSSNEGESIFKGEIESIDDSVDDTIQIKVVNVDEIEDPENIGTSFDNDGVTLNVSNDQLVGGKESFQKGDEIKFTLKEKPIMTMSIPPQIPGNSIVEVRVIE